MRGKVLSLKLKFSISKDSHLQIKNDKLKVDVQIRFTLFPQSHPLCAASIKINCNPPPTS